MTDGSWVTRFFIIDVAVAVLTVPVTLLLHEYIGASSAAVWLLTVITYGVVMIWKHRGDEEMQPPHEDSGGRER